MSSRGGIAVRAMSAPVRPGRLSVRVERDSEGKRL